MSKNLRIVLFAVGAAVVLAVGVAALGTWLLYRTLTAPPAPSTAEPVPASVELTTVDGRTLTFGDLRGRVVLLDFWATWCGPCRMAIPSLRRLDESFAGEPFTLVSVSLDGERRALLDFLEEEGNPEEGTAWPQVWDGERELDERFDVSGLPTFVLLDGEGRPVYRSSGWAPFKGSVLGWRIRRHVEALDGGGARRTAGFSPPRAAGVP